MSAPLFDQRPNAVDIAGEDGVRHHGRVDERDRRDLAGIIDVELHRLTALAVQEVVPEHRDQLELLLPARLGVQRSPFQGDAQRDGGRDLVGPDIAIVPGCLVLPAEDWD